MKKDVGQNESSTKKPFVKPELKALDIRNTLTGGAPDPTEFNPFLQKTS